MIAAAVTRPAVSSTPGTATEDVVNLAVRKARGPRTRTYQRAPSRQQRAKQWSPTVEVAREDDGQGWLETIRERVELAVLAKRAVTEVRSVYAEHVERLLVQHEARNDDGSLHLLLGESAKRLDVDLLDGQTGQKSEPPLTRFEYAVSRTSGTLASGEFSMLLKVESVFAGEVSEPRQP